MAFSRLLHILLSHLVFIIVTCCVISFSACSHTSDWKTKDISGLMPNLEFKLTEANSGSAVTASDYRNRFIFLYFGYTNCPDVCPATLTKFKSIISSLGTQASMVQFLFVTVDPARDSLAKMKSYTHYFGPEFIGLRGSQDELKKLTKRYRVTYGYNKPDEHGFYEVSHSSAVYVFDTSGKARLLIRPTDSTGAIEHDLRKLLDD